MSLASYRKTKDGQWVVYGPVSYVQPGRDVLVAKTDGSSKNEHIISVGRSFVVDGKDMVYGYLTAQATKRTAPRRTRSSNRSSCPTDGNCSSFGTGRSCGSPDCDGW